MLNDLIILMPCSGKKKANGARPALEMYLGPLWQTLRQWRPEALGWENVFVLSGGYGFISALDVISPYEQKLPRGVAKAMPLQGVEYANHLWGARNAANDYAPGPSPLEMVRMYRHGKPAARRVINAGAGDYRDVFDAFVRGFIAHGVVEPDATVDHVAGGIGYQRQQLGQWLRDANVRSLGVANDTSSAE